MDRPGEQRRGGGPTSSEQIMETAALLLPGMTEMDKVCTASIFFHVAGQMFSDGITWGRVAVLFCYSSKLTRAQGSCPGAAHPHSFICDQIGPAAKDIDELGPELVSQDPYIKELGKVLKRKAQEMDKDKELQRMIDTDRVFTAGEVFEVAQEIFSDGYTWGRIVAFIWFISKLVLKALCTDMRELITSIMGWTLDFIRQRLLPWIQEQGGWDGLLSQHSNQVNWLTVVVPFITVAVSFTAVLVAIIAVAVDFIREQQLPWIQDRGGWDGLLWKLGYSLKWMAAGALAIGIGLLALLGLRGT
ncbi:apoptosis regulator BAX-like [Talpa occidentalis]|uniref:apoptosis regulator BAX-like n=1 Tax=Talpa occidentalis TaxID=50954 RepID=UPI0018908ED4|nr:apoptosis regulator BAX-like [Talpa occidentalis]